MSTKITAYFKELSRQSIGVIFMVFMMALPLQQASATSWFWPKSAAQKSGKMSTLLVAPPDDAQSYATPLPMKVPLPGVWGSPTDPDLLTVRDKQNVLEAMQKPNPLAQLYAVRLKDKKTRLQQALDRQAAQSKARPVAAAKAPGILQQKRTPHKQRLPLSGATRSAPMAQPVAPTAPTSPIRPILPKAPAYQAPRIPAGDWEKVSPNPAPAPGSGIQPIIIPNRTLQKRQQIKQQPTQPAAPAQNAAPGQ